MNPKCPIESTLSLVNGKWRLLILKALSSGPVRFGALERCIAEISAKVLTQQLREMERDGLVLRKIFPEVPPRVEYSLNKMGVNLFKIFVELRRWGLEENSRQDIECSGCFGCSDCRPSPYYTEG
jgi:DNA-binding HxlR family transcriptional regulator